MNFIFAFWRGEPETCVYIGIEGDDSDEHISKAAGGPLDLPGNYSEVMEGCFMVDLTEEEVRTELISLGLSEDLDWDADMNS